MNETKFLEVGLRMVWRDRFPKNVKPAYNELLEFFQPNIRELFLAFDKEMRNRFKVDNKYHRYSNVDGWKYGFGHGYGCELLVVAVQSDCFHVLSVSVKDEASLAEAIDKAQKLYDSGFEERYAAICEKRRASQIERSKKRVERETLQIAKIMETVDASKFNKFVWCKKVSRKDLERLYQSDAKGMLDETLLDDIGYTFYTRCKQSKEAWACMRKGEIICHHCHAVLAARNKFNMPVTCTCGYSYTYREYRRSCCAANMPSGRATPIFHQFIEKWQGGRTSAQKMMLIDWLIHEFHVTLMSNSRGRSVCMNLIDGSQKQIKELIEKLAYK